MLSIDLRISRSNTSYTTLIRIGTKSGFPWDVPYTSKYLVSGYVSKFETNTKNLVSGDVGTPHTLNYKTPGLHMSKTYLSKTTSEGVYNISMLNEGN